MGLRKIVILLLLLLLAGAIAGWQGQLRLLPDVWIEATKWLSWLFGFITTAMLWLIPKLEELTDTSSITYQEQRRLEATIRGRLRFLKITLFGNFLGSGIMMLPAWLKNSALPPGWFAPVVGLAFGFAVYACCIFFVQREEVRAFRAKIKERERVAAARDKALAELSAKEGKGYESDPRLDCYRNGQPLPH